LLRKLKNEFVYRIKDEDTARCAMLHYNEDGQASCLLHEFFGFEAKPKRCRVEPERNARCCRFQELSDG
jgi:hypothetical protein